MNDAHSDSTPSRPLGEDSVGYDPTTGTFHARFDADSTSVIVAIVEAVGIVTNRDPTTLSPLFATIDPEALTDLVTSTREPTVDVTFSYEDCDVTVSSHGTIVVEPPRE